LGRSWGPKNRSNRFVINNCRQEDVILGKIKFIYATNAPTNK